ncbi:MAG: hypothetical protein PCFJNLEI_01100 [Verrucomicrobiae bacterium]|nr:hypothetical protein [Verrucomicrobiae bacterium]
MSHTHREYPPSVSYLIAVLMSVAHLTFLATIPYKLKTLGGGLDTVGFVFTWMSAWYIVAGLALGWLSQRYGPRRVMLTCVVIAGGVAGLTPFTTAVWQVYLVGMIYSTVACVFWAALEHASTGLHAHLTLIQSTAIFCMAFSLGNAAGQMSSSLLVTQTVALPFLLAAGMLVLVFILIWVTVSPEAGFRRSTPADIAAFPEAARQRLRRSLLAGRIGLVGTYGMYCLATLFLPRYLWEHRGFSKPLAGSMSTVLLLTMAVTFAWHGRSTRWPHRLWIVRSCPFLAAGSVLLVGLGSSVAVIGLGAVLVGIVAATAYSHNLYYSLEEPGQRARNAGIHEAVVGLGFMLAPFVGGAATRWTQVPESIFWAGAALAVVTGIVQNVALAVSRPR